MRSQGCTIQQALTPEATAVVKQAVALAKRRGHAQVTPLHVAQTMLSVSSGLLRAACLQAHAHPLQCRALELCFNVALNRLPTLTASGPMLGPHLANHHPTIANALIAAFKRAQAHQRRGSVENQQQPLLAVKIELEQLIISILDDPSVSRVMREAGFSSTLVKGKVEQAISIDLGSQNQAPNNNIKPKDNSNDNNNSSRNNSCHDHDVSMDQSGLKMEKPRRTDQGGKRKDDVKSVIDSLMNRRRKRNSVVVGECIETLEGLIREVVERVEKGDVLEALKEVKFVPLGISSFRNLSKEEVEQRVKEVKCLVKSCMENNKGVILYLDDLKWVNELKGINIGNTILGDHYQPRSCYCPIEHMVMEIGKLILSYAECERLWVLGIATFQTYMKCKGGQPSLESILGLHVVTIPTDSLGLSLIPDSDTSSPMENKKESSLMILEGEAGVRGGGDVEVQSHRSSVSNNECTTSRLPSWLQQYKDENNKRSSNDQDSVPVKDLWKRWSSFCPLSTHASPTISTSSPSLDRSLSFSSISPSSSTSNFSYDHHNLKLQATHQNREPNNFWFNEASTKTNIPGFTLYVQDHKRDCSQQWNTSFIPSNPSSTPTSTSSSDIMDQTESKSIFPRFKECNKENLKTLCYALEQKVPKQKDIIMDIVSTILQCRSGLVTRKGTNGTFMNNKQGNKEETWLFFQGVDTNSKEIIARELASLVFGSQDKFVTISLSSFSSTRVDSTEDCRNKRLRDEQSCSYIERFATAVSIDPHRVFFIEDIDQVDYFSMMGIKKAIERGRIPKFSSKEDVSLSDAIIILSCENFKSRSRACSPSAKQKMDISPREDNKKNACNGDGVAMEEIISPSISLDLNISINDNDDDHDDDACDVSHGESMDEIGLLACVDRCIVFDNHGDHDIRDYVDETNEVRAQI